MCIQVSADTATQTTLDRCLSVPHAATENFALDRSLCTSPWSPSRPESRNLGGGHLNSGADEQTPTVEAQECRCSDHTEALLKVSIQIFFRTILTGRIETWLTITLLGTAIKSLRPESSSKTVSSKSLMQCTLRSLLLPTSTFWTKGRHTSLASRLSTLRSDLLQPRLRTDASINQFANPILSQSCMNSPFLFYCWAQLSFRLGRRTKLSMCVCKWTPTATGVSSEPMSSLFRASATFVKQEKSKFQITWRATSTSLWATCRFHRISSKLRHWCTLSVFFLPTWPTATSHRLKVFFSSLYVLTLPQRIVS